MPYYSGIKSLIKGMPVPYSAVKRWGMLLTGVRYFGEEQRVFLVLYL
jgi:hypothetical protein